MTAWGLIGSILGAIGLGVGIPFTIIGSTENSQDPEEESSTNLRSIGLPMLVGGSVLLAAGPRPIPNEQW